MSRHRIRNKRNVLSGDHTLFLLRRGEIPVKSLIQALSGLEERKVKAGCLAFLKSLPVVCSNEFQQKLYNKMLEHPEYFAKRHRFPEWKDTMDKDFKWTGSKRDKNHLEPIIYSAEDIGPREIIEQPFGSWRSWGFLDSLDREDMSRDYMDYGLTMVRRGRLTAKQIKAFKQRILDSTQEKKVELLDRAIWTMLLRIYTPPVDVSKWQQETEENLFG